jgi:hypothetical protein
VLQHLSITLGDVLPDLQCIRESASSSTLLLWTLNDHP